MEPLLKHFFDNTFPGFNDTVTLEDPILRTNVPLLDLDLGIDVDSLLALVKQCELSPVIHKIYPYEHYPRIHNFFYSSLWCDGSMEGLLTDIYNKAPTPNLEVLQPNKLSQKIRDELAKYNLNIRACFLSVLDPGGYIRPHRDMRAIDHPLNYFWLPLEDVPESELKVYPYGTVDVKLGHLYMLNQENFTHAVVNLSNSRRHVIVGHLHNPVPELKTIIENNLRSQYQIIG